MWWKKCRCCLFRNVRSKSGSICPQTGIQVRYMDTKKCAHKMASHLWSDSLTRHVKKQMNSKIPTMVASPWLIPPSCSRKHKDFQNWCCKETAHCNLQHWLTCCAVWKNLTTANCRNPKSGVSTNNQFPNEDWLWKNPCRNKRAAKHNCSRSHLCAFFTRCHVARLKVW